MTIRQVVWAVGEDHRTVTPAAPQEGGVQGEDNATEAVFDLTAAPALTAGDLTLYVECIDAAGGYDKTPPLPVQDGRVRTPVPLCWTQYGGVITLRLTGEREGQVVYTLTGRMRLDSRPTAARQVDTLLRTHIQETLDTVETVAKGVRVDAADAVDAADNAREAEALARAEADRAAGAAAQTFADRTQTGMDAVIARQAAADAAATEQRVAAIAVPDDTTVRADGLWSGKGTADRLCPPWQETGRQVTAHPLPGYPLQVTTAAVYNYLDLSYLTPTQSDGVTVTPLEDGGIRLDGVAGEHGGVILSTPVGTLATAFGLEPEETYRLSGCPAGGEGAYRLCLTEDSTWSIRVTDTGEGAAFVPGAYTYSGCWVLHIALQPGTVCEGLVFYPRITRAADTPTTITRCGKNRLDVSRPVSAVTVTTKNDGTRVEYYGYRLALPPGSYPLHAERIAGTATRYIYSTVNTAAGGFREKVNVVTGTRLDKPTVTLEEGDVLYVYNGNASSSLEVSDKLFGEEYRVQVEAGTVATPYEPYRGETVSAAPSGVTTVIAGEGSNTLYADVGPIAVSGRLDVAHLLQALLGGEA